MKVTIKAFVHKAQYGDGYSVYSVDMSKYGDTPVGPCEFEYELAEGWNPIKAEVDMLEKKLDQINKEHVDQVLHIKDRVAKLLCLEFSPAPERLVLP